MVEKELLRQFDEGVNAKNLELMRVGVRSDGESADVDLQTCAATLVRFNGGANCVRQWVCTRPSVMDMHQAERDEELIVSGVSDEVCGAIVDRMFREIVRTQGQDCV